MKRTTIFRLLILCLVFSLFVPMAPLLAEDRPTISYYGYGLGALDPGSYCELFVEDGLDMDIELRKVSHTDKEAVNLMLASGEMPDCGWFEHSIDQMEDEELIRYIPVDLVEEYFPGFIKLADDNPIIYKIALDPEDSTHFRFFPAQIFAVETNLHNNCIYLRDDLIKNLRCG